MVDLILERGGETNVAGRGLALNAKSHTVSTTRPPVFVAPLIELPEIQKLIVNQHRSGVL